MNKSQRRRAASKKQQQQRHQDKVASLVGQTDTGVTDGLDPCRRVTRVHEPEPEQEPEPLTNTPEAARSTFSIERTLWKHEGAPRVSLLRGRIAWKQWSKAGTISAGVRCGPADMLAPPPRRHQLRRHLSGASHPVLGDTQYGKGRINGCAGALCNSSTDVPFDYRISGHEHAANAACFAALLNYSSQHAQVVARRIRPHSAVLACREASTTTPVLPAENRRSHMPRGGRGAAR